MRVNPVEDGVRLYLQRLFFVGTEIEVFSLFHGLPLHVMRSKLKGVFQEMDFLVVLCCGIYV